MYTCVRSTRHALQKTHQNVRKEDVELSARSTAALGHLRNAWNWRSGRIFLVDGYALPMQDSSGNPSQTDKLRMSTLKSIAIKGFKSFGDETEVPLGQLNVLIGANGSGKSNFLGAFAFLQAVSSGDLDRYVAREGGADQILHFGSRRTEELSMRATFADSDWYELRFMYGDGDCLYVGKPRFPDMGARRRNVVDRLDAWHCYHFLDTSRHSRMKKTGKLDDNRFLRPDGANLAAFLYFLRNYFPLGSGLRSA